jgi:hypothetical protein
MSAASIKDFGERQEASIKQKREKV